MDVLKAVILDLDDTMCMTEEGCWRLENEVLAAMKRPPIPRNVHKDTWGKKLFEEAIGLRSPGIDVDEFRIKFEPAFQRAIDENQLDVIPDENLRAIDRLIGLGLAVVVLTSREEVELRHLLEPDHELADRIEAFYYHDNMDFHKPDPRAFAVIEQCHGWLPQECVYVGDSPGDAIAAKGARLHFIASLESGLRVQSDFTAPVDRFINKFPEVVFAIQDLDASL